MSPCLYNIYTYRESYNIFRQKAHGFNRGMNATCM